MRAFVAEAHRRGGRVYATDVDALAPALFIADEAVRSRSLVDSYRTYPPTIALIPGLEEVLQGLRRQGLRLGVITDGPPSSQAAKAMAQWAVARERRELSNQAS